MKRREEKIISGMKHTFGLIALLGDEDSAPIRGVPYKPLATPCAPSITLLLGDNIVV